ncbi:MAG TPA: IPT/TIG domain-containing protein [Chitinophagaceae bacterium]|nr:IPT/TIG domain-containing protein [Chitinophagaceae bacterium]
MIRFLLLALFAPAVILSCKKQGDSPNTSSSTDAPVITSFSPGKGGNGIAVTITGKNFGKSVVPVIVYFNGAASNPASVNDSTIIVNVPATATTGKITVSVSGQKTVSSGSFQVLPGLWLKQNDLPAFYPRTNAYGFSIGSKGFIGGGIMGESTNLYGDLWVYDTINALWQQKNNPPIAFMNAVTMVIGNKAYVGIGRIAGYVNSTQFWEYNPGSDTWTRKADFPGSARMEAIGFGVNGKGYAGLGLSIDGGGTTKALADWWQYDPATDTWTQKKSAPVAMQGPSALAAGNMIYAGATTKVSGWYQYNTATDSWVQKSSFPGSAPFELKGFTIGDKGYLAGAGEGCWRYDPSNDTWQQEAFFANYRLDMVAFTIGNAGYCGTGIDKDGASYTDFWKFMP